MQLANGASLCCIRILVPVCVLFYPCFLALLVVFICQHSIIYLGGLNIEGENDSWDFGTGAGFYVDATKAPYDNGYNMYSYVTEELPKTVFVAFPQLDPSRVSITGHSMGGHGALTLVS